MKIVFMGTPEFAVPALRKTDENHQVVAVVTAPDRPAGRGKKLRYSAVKQAAMDLKIPVLQPTNLKSEHFLAELQELDADLYVVVAFRMLPERVWSLPAKGTINLHASLLPQYRGAAPINWAIINGEKTTGLTTFFIEKEIDTGKIIDTAEVPITPNEDAGSLHDKMMARGAELLKRTLHAIKNGTASPRSQQWSDKLQGAPKLFKENTQIDWTKGQEALHNFIRGLSPYPAAYTITDGDENFKILASEITAGTNFGSPGDVKIDADRLLVQTGKGVLSITVLQAPGKKRMNTVDFLRGFRDVKTLQFR